MNTNVINPSVRFNGFGELSIIGQSQHAVTFKVTCWSSVGGVRFDKLAKSWILTRLNGEMSNTLIFEYSLRGELQNPHKLLKSVRSKLTHLVNLARNEFDVWHADYYRGSDSA
jgi:hypothetical protein